MIRKEQTMSRRPFFPLFALLVFSTIAHAQTPDIRSATQPLIGTWKLIAIDERDGEGKRVVPLDYGPEPIGMLIYDAAGRMSVHAMRQGRPRFASEDVHSATPEQAKAAFVGYGAYFGTYTVDEQAGIVTHHVEGALNPNWEGSDQRRRFTLAGDKLTLSPPEFPAAGQKRTRQLTWQRLPDKATKP
jgi:hypothetical protein